MPTEDAVILREFAPGDLAYVFSTWLRDLRDADPSPLPDDLYFPAHRTLLERLLASPDVKVVVAAAADKPDEILGYCAAIPSQLVVWVHVRKGLRFRGVAKVLLTQLNCPPGTPGAWATAMSKIRLRNPPRGRQWRVQPPFKETNGRTG